ncbi:hypothetical protein ES703_21102 [subsurface metagenome]
MKTKIRIDRESGLAYIAKALRDEGFVGEVVALANARTLTLIMPGTKLADVKRSLDTIINDLDLRIEYEEEPQLLAGVSPEDEK